MPRAQESELTPSGANLLDGRYAVFGYVVEGQELLQQLQARGPAQSVRSQQASHLDGLLQVAFFAVKIVRFVVTFIMRHNWHFFTALFPDERIVLLRRWEI